MVAPIIAVDHGHLNLQTFQSDKVKQRHVRIASAPQCDWHSLRWEHRGLCVYVGLRVCPQACKPIGMLAPEQPRPS